MRHIRILLRDYKIIENLRSTGWLHRVERPLHTSISYKDFER